MQLSLVLATCNNAESLGNLLGCLTRCLQPESWELIVVDNKSTDTTADVINSYAARLPVKYLFEGIQGKSRALNNGIRHATGDIVLFSDDDIVPDGSWLVNHVRVMREHPEIDIVGGRISVDKSALPAWLVNSFNLTGILVAEHDLGDSELIYDTDKYPYGPNIAVRRSALVNVDKPWPEHLGPGRRLPVGDEMVFIHNIGRAGQQRLYTPDCLVEHKPIVRNNFFLKSLRRCFLGGYAAGYYAENLLADKPGNTFLKLTGSRVASCRSIREFSCMVARTAGVISGRIHQQFH